MSLVCSFTVAWMMGNKSEPFGVNMVAKINAYKERYIVTVSYRICTYKIGLKSWRQQPVTRVYEG